MPLPNPLTRSPQIEGMSMEQHRNLTLGSTISPSGAGIIAFSERFGKLVAKSSVQSADISTATLQETLEALSLARKSLPVADASAVRTVYNHNPECFRIVRREPFETSLMMAYLPLNVTGAAALVDGQFDAARPDLHHICTPGEHPEVIYVWLVYVPRNMVAGLRLLKELEVIAPGTAILTVPAHEESARILKMAGFIEAREVFPSAPARLLIALAVDNGLSSPETTITVRVARDLQDLAKIISIRTATYMVEQSCSYAEEFDGNDLAGTHLIGEVNGEPAGCVRIRYFGTFAKLERLAVRSEFRRSRLMWKLVRSAFEFCSRKGFSKLYAHAREDLVPAWERFGAKPIANREPFFFSDVRFVEMELELPPNARSIQLGADPLLLIRPEGCWDELGPIDKAQLKETGARREKNGEIRRLGGRS
jgi:predicted GNAT family N-acyltransferase